MEKTRTTLLEYGNRREYLIKNLPTKIKRCIYGYKENKDYVELLPEQKEVLLDYYMFLINESGKITSEITYKNLMAIVSIFAKFIKKPFNEVIKEDLQQFFFNMQIKGYKESTMNEYKIKLKTFYRFLYGTKEYPDVVSWIQLKKITPDKKTEESLLSREDIKKLLEVSDNPRDRALISVLYETAARRGEIYSVKIKHVIPDKYGMKIKLPKSKTMIRTIRLIDSVPYLQEWLNNHPYRNDVESFLFVSLYNHKGRKLGETSLHRILEKLQKRAKLLKKVYPHIFRHSRLNELAKMGFNERDLQLYAGWSENSQMTKVYLHYDEKHLDDKILQKAGKLTKEESKKEHIKDEILKPRDCPRCKTVNSATSRYCNSCGMVLDLKDYMKDHETIKKETEERLNVYADIMGNPEKKAKFEEFKKMFFGKNKEL